MGKATKATKRFNRKYLKDELERRRKNKKGQELYKKRELKKSKRGDASGDTDSDQDQATGIDEVDDLADFAASTLGRKENLSKFMEADPENDSDAGNSTDSEDMAALLQEDEDDDDGSDDDADLSSGETGETDEDEDEEDVFKKELEAMKEKDPDFFKYMQQNDPASLKILEQNDEDSDEADSDAEMEADESGDDVASGAEV
ncbi:hypothetical protein IW143_005394, partial [Coemansia sp. RSA 520]